MTLIIKILLLKHDSSDHDNRSKHIQKIHDLSRTISPQVDLSWALPTRRKWNPMENPVIHRKSSFLFDQLNIHNAV